MNCSDFGITRYAIGLDVGIASAGWAVVGLDGNDEPCGIVDEGVRVFEKAEAPDTGESLASKRRRARCLRRLLRRNKHRRERLLALLIKFCFITEEEFDNLFNDKLEDIYTLRVRALDERISNLELVRVLLNLTKRRGFKSSRKSDRDKLDEMYQAKTSSGDEPVIVETEEMDSDSRDKASDKDNDKDKEKWRAAIVDNRIRMNERGYRTVGEMFLKDERFSEHKRNKAGSYLSTVDRKFIEEEASVILDTQAALGNTLITEEFKKAFFAIMLSQRPFDVGPGGNSPYGGNQIAKKVGNCTFEKGEKRAAIACYSYEYSNLLQKVNNLRLLTDGESVPLDAAQRETVVQLAFAKADLLFGDIRHALGVGPYVRFNVNIGRSSSKKTKQKLVSETDSLDKIIKNEDKVHFNFLKFYHKLRIALDKIKKGLVNQYSVELRDEIGRIITYFKDDDTRAVEFQKLGFSEQEINAFLSLESSNFGHLSLKALRKITSFLEKGFTYDKACEAAGYDFSGGFGEKSMYLPASRFKAPELDDIVNPVVRRSVSQVIKVVNAIIREQGASPVFIHVELARELSKSFEERMKILKSNNESHERNEKIVKLLREEIGIPYPKGQDIIKYRLWQQQGEISLYSGKKISLQDLFATGGTDIDHIIPYSDSFDDSFNNKAVCFASENRDKGDRVPLEYLSQQYGQAAVDAFKVRVETIIKNPVKKQKLLKKMVTDADRTEFKSRNLNDTRYLSKFLYNFMESRLLFTPFADGRKKHVLAVNGAVTAYYRKHWGIRKDRAQGDLHHAADALVVACVTSRMVQSVSLFSKNKELYHTKDRYNFSGSGFVSKKFPFPWEGFRSELNARLSENPAETLASLNLPFYRGVDLNMVKPLFVSRMPTRSVTGEAHLATVYSPRLLHEHIILSKTPLAKLKLDKKTGEIAGYYNPDSDRYLYNALKAQLVKFKGDGKKAFKEPFYKPNADGTRGPLVRSVRCFEKSTLNVPVLGGKGVAKNGNMVRVDVFYVEGEGYYLVPIYISDTLKKMLPNKAIVAHKPYEQWKEMKEKDFLFSLYPNDLIRVQNKKDMVFGKVQEKSDLPDKFSTRDILVYYKSANIATAAITVVNDDNGYIIKGLGVKTLMDIEKYQVDVLGNYYKVGKEMRMPFYKKI